MILLIFLSVSIAAFICSYYWNRRRFYELAEKLPGVEGMSLLQSARLMLTIKKEDFITELLIRIKEGAPISKFWLFEDLVIMSKDADFINKVFNTVEAYDKPKLFYQGFWYTKGLVSLCGNEHRRHRKILNKAFTSKMLSQLPEIFNEKSLKILQLVKKRENCGEFDVLEYSGAYSLEAFGKSNLNYDPDAYGSKVYHAYEQFSKVMADVLPFLMLTTRIVNTTKVGHKLQDTLKIFESYATESIEATKMNNNNNNNNEDDESINKNTVQLLLDPKYEFNELELREELIMTVLGAFETTTKTLAITLMMLGMHQHVQEKVLKEINEIYSQEADTKFTNEFLQKFSYLEIVIKETMRLFTIAPIIFRKTTAEVEINGYLIPKGANIALSLFSMHREPKYWGSDAHLYRPERFHEDHVNTKAFAPFSGGSRMCIGHRYAMMSMKIFLINFLRTYKISCASKYEDIEMIMTITLDLPTGFKIIVNNR